MLSFFNRLPAFDIGTLLIRLAIGIVFINAGWFKIANMEMVVQMFGTIGIPVWLAYLVTYVEFIGGIALIVGLGVRYVGVLLSVIMVVAIFKAHIMNGYSIANGGYEYPLVLLMVALGIVALGAGRYSLDAFIRRNRS